MTGPLPLLVADDVQVTFERSTTPTVNGASFAVRPGQVVAIVGASGSGKTTLCRALLGLLPATARVSGSIMLDGRELLGLTESQLRHHRGRGIATVLQNPDRSLNPTMRIGEQLTRAVRAASKVRRADASARVVELLGRVELPDPSRIRDSYPHELSGGMRQRVSIAIALANSPRVLIADEPTAALDANTQAAVMRMLTTARRDSGLAVVLVTHDEALAASCAEDILVMRTGRLFANDRDRTPGARSRPPRPPARSPHTVLEIRDLVQVLGSDRSPTTAVDRVTLDVRRGETVGLVGESGCGKSTLAHSVVHSPPPTTGEIRIEGSTISALDASRRRTGLRPVQIVPQHPLGSIDPMWRISDVVAEPLAPVRIGDRRSRRARADEMLNLVGLDPAVWGRRRRNQLSGGQAQQVAIARALVTAPSLIILDEAVSSLDPITTSHILALLDKLQDELGLSYLFIAHDLATVQRSSDRVAVMRSGRICELGPTAEVLQSPRHHYTAALRTKAVIASPVNVPAAGCSFQDQCPRASQLCREVEPLMRNLGTDHAAACHFPLGEAHV